VAGAILEKPSQRASSRGLTVDWWRCLGCISSVGTSIGVADFGVASLGSPAVLMRLEGTVGVSWSLGEPGKAPGISSLSWRDASFAGTVRGARAGVSWDRETLFTGYVLVSKRGPDSRHVRDLNIPAAWPSSCSTAWSSDGPLFVMLPSGVMSLQKKVVPKVAVKQFYKSPVVEWNGSRLGRRRVVH